MKKEDYKVDPGSIKVDQRKKDTRRDAWNRDYMPLDYSEFEEACKIEPKKTIRLCSLHFSLLQF